LVSESTSVDSIGGEDKDSLTSYINSSDCLGKGEDIRASSSEVFVGIGRRLVDLI
jgi:hypothetical protein